MLIFVYGSLRGGHPYLGDAESLGLGTAKGYTLINLGAFPGMIPEESGHVIGEVFNVDPDQFQVLDHFEGGSYQRKRVAVQIEGRKAPLHCQAYVFRYRPRGFHMETFADWYTYSEN
jgi:gamma-glutamylcyclotransferase (GGCT)/AIG2-like uncharacterized protein YtfP